MGGKNLHRERREACARHAISQRSVSRYRGKIWAWDVVNEPIEPKDGLDNGYRNSMWFRQLGIDYVDLAFRLARATDVKTPLSLNEYGFEYTTAGEPASAAGTYSRCCKCFALATRRSTASGCSRILLATGSSIGRSSREFLRKVVDLGYRLMITELDVDDGEISGSESSVMPRSRGMSMNISTSCSRLRAHRHSQPGV